MLLHYTSPRWHSDAGPVDAWLQRWMDAGWRHVPPSMGGTTSGVPVNIGGVDYLGFQFVRDPEMDRKGDDQVMPYDPDTMRALEQPDPFAGLEVGPSQGRHRSP